MVANTVFPQQISFTNRGGQANRTTAGYSVVDENSTLYSYAFADPPSEAQMETQNTLAALSPLGWLDLVLRIPFNMSRDATGLRVSTIFSTGTFGGSQHFWTVSWRLYNSSVIASSGNWDYSMVVSANSSMTLCKNLGANLDESNISLCSPGPWYYEATLIVHNATLFSAARTYQNQYNLFLEVYQETTSASIFCERSFVTVLISAITVAVVLGVYVAGRRKRPFRSRSALVCS